MKVLITSNSFGKFDNGPKQKMLDLGWEVVGNRYHHIMNEEEMIGEVPGVDAIILGSDCLNKNVLDHADKLKIISRYGVGLDNVDLEEAKQRETSGLERIVSSVVSAMIRQEIDSFLENEFTG